MFASAARVVGVGLGHQEEKIWYAAWLLKKY